MRFVSRSSVCDRVVPRNGRNDFEPAVVIPTRLRYVYTVVSTVRGEVEQKRKARGDELDLVDHLSFSSTFVVLVRVVVVSFFLLLLPQPLLRPRISRIPRYT